MQWLKVTQNEAVFRGRDNYIASIDKVSKNFVGLAFNFTPTWFQVFPGVDILAPVTWSQGLSGNAAVAFGGNEGGGNYASASRPTSTRSTGSISSTPAITATTRPTRRG